MEVCQNEAQIKTAIKEPKAEALVLTENGIHLTAFWARLLSGCGTDGKFDPIFVMENVITRFDSSFNYEIVEKAKWLHGEFLQAYYSPEKNKIVIRGDVYERALAGEPLDVITVAHEVMHCVQSIVMRVLNAMKCIECCAVTAQMKCGIMSFRPTGLHLLCLALKALQKVRAMTRL